MMVLLASTRKRESIIVEICTVDRTRVQAQQEINSVFATYYQQLYAMPISVEVASLRGFLDPLTLRSVLAEVIAALRGPMSTQEFAGVIKRMSRGRVAGVDGLPVEFYLTFGELLLLKLV